MKTLLKNWFLRKSAIRNNVKVGQRFHVGPGSTIWAPRALDIGDDVYIGKNVTIEVDGVVGDGVLIANLVGIVGRKDHFKHEVGTSIRESHWVGDFPDDLSLKTVIGSDVWIGYGAIVLSGIKVGDSSVIASGAIVTKDVEANTIVAGNPGKVIGKRFSDLELQEHWLALREKGHRILVGLETERL
jgi:acetyltransferase-like isoleucine patch superfamily enzyme